MRPGSTISLPQSLMLTLNAFDIWRALSKLHGRLRKSPPLFFSMKSRFHKSALKCGENYGSAHAHSQRLKVILVVRIQSLTREQSVSFASQS